MEGRFVPLARLALVLAGVGSRALCLGFVLEAAWATALWPWEERPLSYLFLASIAAAIALPLRGSGSRVSLRPRQPARSTSP